MAAFHPHFARRARRAFLQQRLLRSRATISEGQCNTLNSDGGGACLRGLWCVENPTLLTRRRAAPHLNRCARTLLPFGFVVGLAKIRDIGFVLRLVRSQNRLCHF